MNDTLFEIPEQLSPRLAWIKEHQVRTHHKPGTDPETSYWLPWSAWLPKHDFSPTERGCFALAYEHFVGYGLTEEDAIIDLAKVEKIKLWNQP